MSEVERASINTFAAIEMVDRYWKFDENQQPTSSWHDKQELLDALMRASVVAPIVSGRADQDEASELTWDATVAGRAYSVVAHYTKLGDGGKRELAGDADELIKDIQRNFL
jgi:hypothetical protein